MANIVIIGGHGKVALLSEPLLVQAGHQVTAVIRNQEQFPSVEATGAKPVLLNIHSASTAQLKQVFEEANADTIVWTAGAGGGDASRTLGVDLHAAVRSIDAATEAGVKRYVMVSYLGSGAGHRVDEDHSFYAYETAKAVADAYLRDSDLQYTILGPGTLLEEDFDGIEVNLNPENAGTSRQLVAEVIAACIADDSSIGKAIPFSNGSDEVVAAVAAAPQRSNFRK